MFLGIDLGTSGVKIVLVDDDQKIVGSADASLDVMRPHDGWSEQSPADWISATKRAMSILRRDHAHQMMMVEGVGLSGQMHGATLLDEADKPLRPCILWNDTRSHAQAAKLDAIPAFREKTGNIVFPGFTAPKLAWVRDEEPEIFAKVKKVLLPKDYLRLWLTGEHISEMSDSSGTSWLNVGQRVWDDELLAATDLTIQHMPKLVEGSAEAGTLRPFLAAEMGLPGHIPVAGGGGDNAASAIGMGTVAKGNAFASLGTSGVLFAANDAYLPNAQSAVHAFCHALPDTWHQMGVILSATDALNWYAGITGTTAAELAAECGETLQGPSGATFLPYLAGERTPHNDAVIRGTFANLSHDTSRNVMTRAVLDGVSYAFRDCLEALRDAGTELTKVTAVGGGSRSKYWLETLATVLGIPIEIPEDGDFGAAFGAARLAMIATGRGTAEEICTPPAVTEAIAPNAKFEAAYEDGYARYRALYPAVRSILGENT
ncbi:MAG: xylulokinase [Pseudomonadota bacterium]